MFVENNFTLYRPWDQMVVPTMHRESNYSVAKGGEQWIYISDRRDSTPLRLSNIWFSQPLPACSSILQTEQGESNVCKTKGGAVPSITDICIFFDPVPQGGHTLKTLLTCSYRNKNKDGSHALSSYRNKIEMAVMLHQVARGGHIIKIPFLASAFIDSCL